MSGYLPGKKLPSAPSDARRQQSDDPCDLRFRTDLVGVRVGIEGVEPRDTLAIELRSKGAIRSVVCVSGQGAIVGTLAAFQGLAQLIRCLAQENRYVAVVETVSLTQCTVLVHREPK